MIRVKFSRNIKKALEIYHTNMINYDCLVIKYVNSVKQQHLICTDQAFIEVEHYHNYTLRYLAKKHPAQMFKRIGNVNS